MAVFTGGTSFLIPFGWMKRRALAIQEVAREKVKTFLIASAATSDLTGKACNETSTQWSYDTYALSNVVAREVVRRGGKDWFFITADYAFGHALERDATRFISAAGGRVLGSIKTPLNAPDFSSFLMQATSQPFSVLALATAGGGRVPVGGVAGREQAARGARFS